MHKTSLKIVTIASFIFCSCISLLTLKSYANEANLIACTQEAKICADGSSAVRTGPNCEFTPCPNEKISDHNKGCTKEAKRCPDGTFVGRSGPNCEFNCSKPKTINIPRPDAELR